jgi:hypothetical protein
VKRRCHLGRIFSGRGPIDLAISRRFFLSGGLPDLL